MNPLEIPAPNSILLMDERLKKLKDEVAMIEREIEPMTKVLPLQKLQTETRYQELPPVEAEPPKKIHIKPQIKPEYKRTLQYVPNIMTGYDINIQETQFLSEVQSLPLPPKISRDSSLLYSYLETQAKKVI